MHGFSQNTIFMPLRWTNYCMFKYYFIILQSQIVLLGIPIGDEARQCV